MANRLKSTDAPEPWFSKKKGNSRSTRQQKTVTTSTVGKNYSPVNATDNSKKRSQRRGQEEPRAGDAGKRTKRGKGKSASALSNVLNIAETAVPDVDELRRKREEDAVACGRTVKTVWTAINPRSGPDAALTHSAEGKPNREAGSGKHCVGGPSSPTASAIPTRTEADKEVDEDVPGTNEDATDGRSRAFMHRPGKEPIEDEILEPLQRRNRNENAGQLKPVAYDIRSDSNSEEEYANSDRGNRGRRESPISKYSNDRYRGRSAERSGLLQQERQSRGRRRSESPSRSPRRKYASRPPMRDNRYRSPRRSDSRSPVHQRRNGHHGSARRLRDNYEESRVPSWVRHEEEYRKYRMSSEWERQHHRGYDTSSPESGSQRRSSRSSESDPRIRNSSTPLSSWSPPRRSGAQRDGRAIRWKDSTPTKERDIAETSVALDRSQRRRRQVSRDSEKAVRQREGKKPFYLMLDGQGQPYSTGKPAWIAEVSKLAKYLDPFCMDVRKQTFQDVQTLKDRLNEKFEYSGQLNEGYLRGLMGKAVTKRRGELLSLIRNGGSQPKHVDYEVWLRLEKLADSEQQKEKSEQGRYANSCRRNVGRTGSIGESGVRENLRLSLDRSPDPDEVHAEMQRDKGYGGRKRKMKKVPVREGKKSGEIILYDDDRSAQDEPASGLSGHAVQGGTSRNQTNGRGVQERAKEMEIGTEGTGNTQANCSVTETEKLSTEEYIRKLQTEIARLQAYEMEALVSGTRKLGESSN